MILHEFYCVEYLKNEVRPDFYEKLSNSEVSVKIHLFIDDYSLKVGKETIIQVNIETEEEFNGVKNFYTSRKMIVAKFYDIGGKPTQLTQDIQKGKKHRVKIIKQRFGNGREDFDIAKS